MKKVILSFSDLSIGYQDSVLLKKLNANLYENSLVVLMGKNGTGKSCLLKTISGLLQKKAGSIIIKDREIDQLSLIEKARIIAVVLTEKVQVDFLTVYELVSLGRSPFVNSNSEFSDNDFKLIEESLQLLNISEIRNCYFQELSDGQKQKVMIARALAQTPQILILDEPTTYLDIPTRLELMENLKYISKEKKITLLISSHDSDLAIEYSDCVWHINNDLNLEEVSPTEVNKLFTKFV
jgi:iron complex transport system ATP-binding protein